MKLICQNPKCNLPFRTTNKKRKYCSHDCYLQDSVGKELPSHFKKGNIPKVKFQNGHIPKHTLPLGSVKFRVRKGTDDRPRRYIKVSMNPVKWIELSKYNWIQAHGEIPKGMRLNFKDGQELNEELDNLELLTIKEWVQKNPGYNKKKER